MSNNSNGLGFFDEAFFGVEGLTWLPYVGASYWQRSERERLLIVGESHYVKAATPEQLDAALVTHRYPEYTRDIITECPINGDWPSRTLDAIPRVLFNTAAIDRARFWGDTAYYNFVQRAMHYDRDGGPERPGWEDFFAGWKVFLAVVNILRPSHCLFLGAQASNHFVLAMQAHNALFSDFRWTKKINRTYAREARLTVAGHALELCFIKHPGKYFSPDDWHDFLQSRFAGLMAWLGSASYLCRPHA